MKLKVPSLDKRQFEDLWEQALRELPGLTQEWTNFNLADPGVVLVEYLLFFLDLFYWRLDFFGEEEKEAYRALLKARPQEALHQWWKRHLEPSSGITARDLAQIIAKRGEFDRVYVYPDHEARLIKAVVIAEREVSLEELTRLEDELEREGLRPLTMDLVLLPPEETNFRLRVSLYPVPGFRAKDLEENLKESLSRYLSPISGLKGEGYPPGRPLYLSEIYACFEQTEGVEGIASLSLWPDPPGEFDGRRLFPGAGRFLKLSDLRLLTLTREEAPCL